jgi:site-specific recombinase XerD
MVERDWLARFEEYLVRVGMAPATIANYLGDVRDFCHWQSSHLSNTSLLDAHADHVRRYCQALRLRGRSAATINRRLQAVRKFYDFAVLTELSSHNPARDVERVTEGSAAPPRVLTANEAHKLLCAVGNDGDGLSRRDRAIVCLLLNTGLKVSELVDLRVEDLELDVGNGYLLVGQDAQQGGRCLSLGSEACAVLRAYMRVRASCNKEDHLFVSRQGQRLSVRSVQRLVSGYARAAGLDGVSAHTLRYTFAHDALEDQDLPEVARMLGLRDAADVRRYRG